MVHRYFTGSKRSASYALGLFFIFLVAIIWAGASVLIQHIYTDMHFESPFLLTFICTSLFSVYLPWTYLCVRLGWTKNPPWRDPTLESSASAHERRPNVLYSTVHNGKDTGQGPMARIPDELPLPSTVLEDPSARSAPAEAEEYSSTTEPLRWSHLKTLRTAVVVFPLFFIANFSYNLSLAHTSVTSNTIISTTSSLWTFLFSTCRGLERFAWVKMAGLLLSMGGTVLVGLADRNGEGTNSVAGDALCLFAAIMYGVYTTALRVLVPDDRSVSFQLLFGYVGLLSLLLLLPPTLLLLLTHALPSVFAGLSLSVLGFIVLNGLADNVLSDYLWARSIVLTSPTVATVGLSLTIPLAFLSDAALGKAHGGLKEVLGAVAVAAGFGLVSWEQKEEAEAEEEEREGRRIRADVGEGNEADAGKSGGDQGGEEAKSMVVR